MFKLNFVLNNILLHCDTSQALYRYIYTFDYCNSITHTVHTCIQTSLKSKTKDSQRHQLSTESLVAT